MSGAEKKFLLPAVGGTGAAGDGLVLPGELLAQLGEGPADVGGGEHGLVGDEGHAGALQGGEQGVQPLAGEAGEHQGGLRRGGGDGRAVLTGGKALQAEEMPHRLPRLLGGHRAHPHALDGKGLPGGGKEDGIGAVPENRFLIGHEKTS